MGGYGAVLQCQNAVGKGHCVLGIVRAQQYRISLPAQTAHLLQNTKLIAVIQCRGRLVHDENIRLLGNGAGDEHQLLLAAGEMRKITLRQMRHPHTGERLMGGVNLRALWLLERGELARSAHQRRVQHGIAEGGPMGLGDVGDAPGPFTVRQTANLLPIHKDGAAILRQCAQNAAKQRAFPHAVGPQHREKFALFRAEADIVQHAAFAVGKGYIFHQKAHSTCSFRVIR